MRLRRGAHAMRQHWLVTTVVALVVVVGAGGWLVLRPDDATAQDQGQSRTVTSTVAKTTVQQSVTASGTVDPTTSDTLTFPTGGTVTSVLVAEGDTVKKGQVLARMDDSSLVATLDAAEATLTSAKEQYTEDADTDAGSTQLASDKAAIVSAEAQVESAQDDADDATMTSPITGTVSAVGYDVGDSTGSTGSGAGQTGSSGTGATTSSTGSSSSSGITVISTGSYEVAATVDSSDLAQLRRGLQAQIVPTGSSTTVYGIVKSIGVVASSSDTSTTGSSSSASFPVTIEVTGSTKGLYAGSSATVTIIVKQQADALTVPSQALSTTNGKTYVTLVEAGKHVRRYVTVGDTYGRQTVVTKGLAAGDTVLLATFTAPRSTGGSGTSRNGGDFGGPPAGGLPSGGEAGGFGAPQ